VENLAQGLDVTGWVKNKFDGSVSMMAESEEDLLMEFLQVIHRSHLGKHITHERVRHSVATGEFPRFWVAT